MRDGSGSGAFLEVDRFLGIQDLERDFIIKIVSDAYNLITNRDAYEWSDKLVARVFDKNLKVGAFTCSAVRMPQRRGSMQMDLQCDDARFGVKGGQKDVWKPFLRIVNSYNCTEKLSYSLGYLLGADREVILSDDVVSLSANHSKNPLREFEEGIKSGTVKAENIAQRFQRQLNVLGKYYCPESYHLAMAFKAYGLKVPRNNGELERFRGMVANSDRIYGLTPDAGSNSYSAFKYLASFATAYSRTIPELHQMQCRLGEFLDKLTEAYSREDLGIETFIGQDNLDCAEQVRKMDMTCS